MKTYRIYFFDRLGGGFEKRIKAASDIDASTWAAKLAATSDRIFSFDIKWPN